MSALREEFELAKAREPVWPPMPGLERICRRIACAFAGHLKINQYDSEAIYPTLVRMFCSRCEMEVRGR
jgi:hypothetical protein